MAGDDLASLVDEYQRQGGASFAETSDRLMVAVAERFLDGRLSYTDADRVANAWWALMCRPDNLQTEPIPTLAQTIFEAFDEGEYFHGDQLDPVQQFTIPLLRSALKDAIGDGGE